MKKLSLHLDDLSVETFATSGGRAEAAGTVHGNLDEAEAPDVVAYPATYPGYPTCNNSCQSCMPTCGVTYYPCCQIG